MLKPSLNPFQLRILFFNSFIRVAHNWLASAVLEALINTESRQALARDLGIHKSTLFR